MTAVHVDGRSSYHLHARRIVTEWPDKLLIILLSYYVVINQYGSHSLSLSLSLSLSIYLSFSNLLSLFLVFSLSLFLSLSLSLYIYIYIYILSVSLSFLLFISQFISLVCAHAVSHNLNHYLISKLSRLQLPVLTLSKSAKKEDVQNQVDSIAKTLYPVIHNGQSWNQVILKIIGNYNYSFLPSVIKLI